MNALKNKLVKKFWPEEDIKVDFTEIYRHLEAIGLNPISTGRKYKRKAVACYMLMVLPFTVITIAGLLYDFSIYGLKQRIEIIAPLIQVTAKTIFLINHKEDIVILMTNTGDFLPLSSVDETDRPYIYKPHRILRFAYQMYRVIIITNALLYIIGPVAVNRKLGIQFLAEDLNGHAPYFKTQCFLFVLVTFYSINLLIGFEGLFYFFSGHIMSELRMVRIAFRNYGNPVPNCSSLTFKAIVRQHAEILRFIKELNEVYSTIFMIICVSNLLGMCFAMFLMLMEGSKPDFHKTPESLSLFLIFASQLWMYCAIGEYISSECLIANDIFYRDWEKRQAYENMIGTIMAIRRAQKPEKLSFGGLAYMNLWNFGRVMRGSLSLLALIYTISNRNLLKQQLMQTEVGA